MKNIKLIALDLDGTLLDSEKNLSQRNRNVLEKCIKCDIQIVPCTGRIWEAVPDDIRNFPGIRYAITTNGAVSEDLQEKKILDERKLDVETAIELLEFAKKFDVMYDAYAGGLAFGEPRFLNRMEDYGIPPAIQHLIWKSRKPVSDVIEQIKQLNRPVEKINYFFGDQNERTRVKSILKKRNDVVVSCSIPSNLELNAPEATKGEAILRLASYLGIAPSETMGFGDEENDISMMRMAGIGVAMRNGADAVKAEADYITVSNDEDGVAKAIEKLVFEH